MAKKVLIGMSGGVDSTISTVLLKEQGYEVEGLYMKLHDSKEYHEKNIARAQKAADYAGVKLHILDFQDDFQKRVFDPFVQSYKGGTTPNPCALCNRNIKFGKMVEFANSIGANFIATGHYIRHDGKYLYEAKDKSKDQSYFLFYIDPSIVSRLIFPMAEYRKSDIKKLASSIEKLESFATQEESSEICFVQTTYTDLLKSYVQVDMRGEVLNGNGDVIGEHKGYMHYTIGKRKGFRVDGAHEPHYVSKILPKTNQIVVGKHKDLEISSVVLENLNMFDERVEFDAMVKLRYRTIAVPCHVKIEQGEAQVMLHKPVFGVAAGQAGVFYEEEKLLGGGWIK